MQELPISSEAEEYKLTSEMLDALAAALEQLPEIISEDKAAKMIIHAQSGSV